LKGGSDEEVKQTAIHSSFHRTIKSKFIAKILTEILIKNTNVCIVQLLVFQFTHFQKMVEWGSN
jgi:hypothetical protein